MKPLLKFAILAALAAVFSFGAHGQCQPIVPSSSNPTLVEQLCIASTAINSGNIVSLNSSNQVVPLAAGATSGGYGVAESQALPSGAVKVVISGQATISTDNACTVSQLMVYSATNNGNGHCVSSAGSSQWIGTVISSSAQPGSVLVQISALSSGFGGGGTPGLSDPGSNSVPFRNALNTTVPAVATNIVALWTGSCSSSTFLNGAGACATAGPGTGTPSAMTYWDPTGAILQSLPSPTSAPGEYPCGFYPTSSSGVSPTCPQVGLHVTSISGAATSYTICSLATCAYDDNMGTAEHDAAATGAVAFSLPTPTTLKNVSFATQLCNYSAQLDTLTPAGSWTINSNATLTLNPKTCHGIKIDPLNSSNWLSIGSGPGLVQNVSSAQSLATTLAMCTTCTINIAATVTAGANATVPLTTTLNFQHGGSIACNAFTVNFQGGSIIAPQVQVFTGCSGLVTNLTPLAIDWFGSNTSSASLTAALAACPASSGCKIVDNVGEQYQSACTAYPACANNNLEIDGITPVVNSQTNPTALTGGTTFTPALQLSGTQGIRVRHIGIDDGILTQPSTSTLPFQIACGNSITTQCNSGAGGEDVLVDDVVVLGQSGVTAYHNAIIQNYNHVQVSHFRSYFNDGGLIVKATNFNLSDLIFGGNTLTGLYLKADNYAPTSYGTVTGVSAFTLNGVVPTDCIIEQASEFNLVGVSIAGTNCNGATNGIDLIGGASVYSLTGVTGASLAGTGTVTLSAFNNSCSGTSVVVNITSGVYTSTGAITAGTSCTNPPTTATCTNGTATCSGTATVTTTLSYIAGDTAVGNAFTNLVGQGLLATGNVKGFLYGTSSYLNSGGIAYIPTASYPNVTGILIDGVQTDTTSASACFNGASNRIVNAPGVNSNGCSTFILATPTSPWEFINAGNPWTLTGVNNAVCIGCTQTANGFGRIVGADIMFSTAPVCTTYPTLYFKDLTTSVLQAGPVLVGSASTATFYHFAMTGSSANIVSFSLADSVEMLETGDTCTTQPVISEARALVAPN